MTQVDKSELYYQQSLLNPYPSESQSSTAYKKGFYECFDIFFKEPLSVHGWINTEYYPLTSHYSRQDEDGKMQDMWQVNEGIPDEFLAAIKVHEKIKEADREYWWIRHCVIEDGRGLCIVGDDLENTPAGWEAEDVAYYMPLPKPPKT